jgi:hypothetical protein
MELPRKIQFINFTDISKKAFYALCDVLYGVKYYWEVYTDPDMAAQHSVPGYYNFVTCSQNFFWLIGGTPATTYYVRARAWNFSGYGPWSELFSVKTLGYKVSGFVVYDKSLEPIPDCTLTLKGMEEKTTSNNEDGSFDFEPVLPGQYAIEVTTTHQPHPCNAGDALAVAKHFANMQPISGLALLAADVNGDRAVNSVDAMLIQKKFIEPDYLFPAGDWVIETVGFDLFDDIFVFIRGRSVGDVTN